MTNGNELAAASVKVSLLERMEVSPSRVVAPIECDEMSFEPPRGLFIAGFAWSARRSAGAELGWEIDENLVDTVVAWSALGNSAKTAQEKVECVLEVGYQEDVPADDLVHLASSGEFSLALVGLSEGCSDEEAKAYCERLADMASRMLRASNFCKSFYPFSNEFEALFLERMGKASDAERMRAQWSKGLVDVKHPAGARVEYALRRTPLGRPDVRAACHGALLGHFGSQDMLDAAIEALARPIAKRVESFADEVKAQPKAKQERFGLTPAE